MAVYVQVILLPFLPVFPVRYFFAFGPFVLGAPSGHSFVLETSHLRTPTGSHLARSSPGSGNEFCFIIARLASCGEMLLVAVGGSVMWHLVRDVRIHGLTGVSSSREAPRRGNMDASRVELDIAAADGRLCDGCIAGSMSVQYRVVRTMVQTVERWSECQWETNR